jgi:ABC-type cobalamin/Fe3+-siderophores transport system ATPase subunit
MLTEKHRPVLIVIAGPNGSGKTTITSKILRHEWLEDALYVNPDQVAQDRFGDWNSPQAVLQAAQYCEEQREACLKNENYQPILLNGDSNVKIYGCVKEVVKKTPRMSYKDCLKIINRAKQQRMTKGVVTKEKAEWAIREIADMVKQGRQWYAVYRPLEEKDVVDEDDYDCVCNMIKEIVPDHLHLPKADELQRMAVLSFRKPVRQWNPKDAPVKGKRFKAYQQIGLQMLALLEG